MDSRYKFVMIGVPLHEPMMSDPFIVGDRYASFTMEDGAVIQIKIKEDSEVYQFTGKTDSNSQKIYEGHIVSFDAMAGNGESYYGKGIVTFEDSEYILITNLTHWPCISLTCVEEMTIINHKDLNEELADQILLVE